MPRQYANAPQDVLPFATNIQYATRLCTCSEIKATTGDSFATTTSTCGSESAAPNECVANSPEIKKGAAEPT